MCVCAIALLDSRAFLSAEPPLITDITQDTTVSVGDFVELRCVAHGYPIPQITWNHDGISLSGSSSTTGQSRSSIISITAAVLQNAGTYTCTASNSQGTDSESLQLVVLSKLCMKSEANVAKVVYYLLHLCT